MYRCWSLCPNSIGQFWRPLRFWLNSLLPDCDLFSLCVCVFVCFLSYCNRCFIPFPYCIHYFSKNHGYWMKGYSCFAESPAISLLFLCVFCILDEFNIMLFWLPATHESSARTVCVITVDVSSCIRIQFICRTGNQEQFLFCFSVNSSWTSAFFQTLTIQSEQLLK